MKVTDLMIGDWIEDVYKKAQVTSITCDGIVETTSSISNIEVVDPIPLTEEILTANGFKKENQTIDGDYCKYILPGFVLNWCDTDGFWYQNGDITPNHVHSLQHLLRLCGIEKEIEL